MIRRRPIPRTRHYPEQSLRRGIGAAWRDDRIEKDGLPWNGAAHWICNVEKG
jgi:hypothetical protein